MKRWSARILLSLMLGLFATLAIAWACALWGTIRLFDYRPNPPPMHGGGRIPVAELADLRPLVQPTFITHEDGEDVIHGALSFWHGPGLREIMLGFGGADDPPHRQGGVTIHRAGWPLPALETVASQVAGTDIWAGGWGPPRWAARSTFVAGAVPQFDRRPPLPLRPVASGLAADTLMFALAWSALLYAPGSIRRRIRRRRGLCPACGYSLSGLTPGAACPECGKGGLA